MCLPLHYHHGGCGGPGELRMPHIHNGVCVWIHRVCMSTVASPWNQQGDILEFLRILLSLSHRECPAQRGLANSAKHEVHSPGFEANTSTFEVNTISQHNWDRTRIRRWRRWRGARQRHALISHKVFGKSFRRSQPPPKSNTLPSSITSVKKKVTFVGIDCYKTILKTLGER